MVYLMTIASDELDRIQPDLLVKQRLTKAFPKSILRLAGPVDAAIALVFNYGSAENLTYRNLSWIGAVTQRGTVGALDRSITVDPLRKLPIEVPFDGAGGLLAAIPDELQKEFYTHAAFDGVGVCGRKLWRAIEKKLRESHPELARLLDWLGALASPPVFDPSDPADRAWQEQQDAAATVTRLAGLPSAALAAWLRPASRDAPYLAGLHPEPVEAGLIDHDVRQAATAFGMTSSWLQGDSARCDIHVLRDESHRVLEVINVNNTRVEARLGTDLIYYHQPTESFVLLQYKRLDRKKSIYVNKQLRGQLKKLEEVASRSRPPRKPSDWRMGSDSCFLKLAYWPQKSEGIAPGSLCPGIYLPLSYVHILLSDDCTRGSGKDPKTRLLGYQQIERYLVGSQFVELVRHGLAGTVGTTVEHLRAIVDRRVQEGNSVMAVAERGPETIAGRQQRARDRGSKPLRYNHGIVQDPLF
ncbi:hypothetical protein HKK72_03965 [Actinomadura sp. HBU206391]|nr:hypothetical protein [Actinomadura sp. HBU206391]